MSASPDEEADGPAGRPDGPDRSVDRDAPGRRDDDLVLPAAELLEARAQPRGSVPPLRASERSLARWARRAWVLLLRSSVGPMMFSMTCMAALTHCFFVTWLTKSPLR